MSSDLSEQRMTELLVAADRLSDHVVSLTSALVEIDSQIPPNADECEIADFISDYVRDHELGKVERFEPVSRRPNLLVTSGHQNHTGPRLLLCGHVDTKPVGPALEDWSTPPLTPTIIDGHLHGLGTSDMKGAVAAMLCAGRVLRESDFPMAGLGFLFTADEERGGADGAARVARQVAQDFDACVIGEPSGVDRDWEVFPIGSRGFAGYRVSVQGTQMHSSLAYRRPEARNASVDLSGILLAFDEMIQESLSGHVSGDWVPSAVVGSAVRAGDVFGVFPGRGEFTIEFRTTPYFDSDAVEALMLECSDKVRALLPGVRFSIARDGVLGVYPPTELDADDLVWAFHSATSRVIGTQVPLGVFPGATDARWLQGEGGLPCLPALGPGLLPLCHGPNERVSVQALQQAVAVYALGAALFLNGPGESGMKHG